MTGERALNAASVSVVIPSFNRRKAVSRAVDSALGQNPPPAEVLVVDDCSTDDTVEWLSIHKRNAVRVIRNEKNRGGGFSRNAGIDEAIGHYIAFLDSDDEWLPGKLSIQLALAETLDAEEGNWVIYSPVMASDGTREKVVPLRPLEENECIGEYLFARQGLIQTSTILLPSALARRTRFDPRLRKHQDYDFVLRLEQQGVKFVAANRPLARWNVDPRTDRITMRRDPLQSEAWLATWRPLLSSDAVLGFKSREVASSLSGARRIFHGEVWMIRALLRGVMTRGEFLAANGQWLLPELVFARCRALVRRIRRR